MKPIDREILLAVRLRWMRIDDGVSLNPNWVHELIGQPEKLVERRMERLEDQGYLESGVSTRTAWLTDKGHREVDR